MYVYAITKGVRLRDLNASHMATAERGWQGLNHVFIKTNGNLLTLIDTCVGTGVGDDYGFYINRGRLDNDPKGLGPYLLAGVEMELKRP